MQVGAAKSLLKRNSSIQGEAICLVIYSDKAHVEYIYALLDQIDLVLEKNGFNPKRLGDEIRSSEDYLEKLETIVNNCSLGLIILDGFRPNVLFEFGYLKAKNKPIIILKSDDAAINIKTLFRETSDSGLTSKQFRGLCNPKVDVSFHLSDFAGKHVSKIDWKTQEKDPLHPSQVLLKEINKKKREIIDETIRIKTMNISKKQEKELLKPIIEVISLYYADKTSLKIESIQNLYSSIKDIANTKNLKPPIEIYRMIVSIYEKKIVETKSISDVVLCLTDIQQINDNILSCISLKKDEDLFASVLMRKGAISMRLFNYSSKIECCYEAISEFKKAMKIYEGKHMKLEYANGQNNIGEAYSALSEIENPSTNCKKAIQAFNESLKIITINEFQAKYTAIQYNRAVAYFNLAKNDEKVEYIREVIKELEKLLKLGALHLLAYQLYGSIKGLLGAAYGKLAKLESRKEMYPKAFEAFEEALKYTSLEKSPVAYAVIQNNLGVDYGELALLENKAENCKKAVLSLNEALKVYTFERFPLDYAFTNTNLCEIYRMLAETEDKVVNCNKAIEACKKALNGRFFEIDPLQYAWSLNNLGSVYKTLAEAADPADNYGKAIEAYNRALTIKEYKLLPKKFANTKKLGEIYHNLFKTSSKTSDYRNAIKEYKQALNTYLKLGDKKSVDLIEESLRDLSELGKNPEISK
jgi:tetratricopeptide (TPR) repeat protein